MTDDLSFTSAVELLWWPRDAGRGAQDQLLSAPGGRGRRGHV